MLTTLGRWCAAVTVTAGVLGGAAVATQPAAADVPGPISATASVDSAAPPTAGGAARVSVRSAAPTLDGFALDWLPPRVGADTVSDFTYSFDDVDFRSRVWESGSPTAGYRVDLDVGVLRSPRLSTSDALYRFLTDYEDREPAEWHFVPFRIHGQRGYLGRDEAFWLVRPGVAVRLSLDARQGGPTDLVRVAEGIHPAS